MRTLFKKSSFWLFIFSCFTFQVKAGDDSLDSLKNYQENTPAMVSSGLPQQHHFATLKAQGVTRVIDLIPGDRSAEQEIVSELSLSYHNIQVEWEHPTLANFIDYVDFMESPGPEGITLTHCKLNWRGAVFTYLYRVIRLNEDEASAKQDLEAIWQPNETWQLFIEEVKHYYQAE